LEHKKIKKVLGSYLNKEKRIIICKEEIECAKENVEIQDI